MVLVGNVVEGAVLAFGEPASMGIELLSVDGVGDDCLYGGIHAYDNYELMMSLATPSLSSTPYHITINWILRLEWDEW